MSADESHAAVRVGVFNALPEIEKYRKTDNENDDEPSDLDKHSSNVIGWSTLP
jgi:hypothetical protein